MTGGRNLGLVAAATALVVFSGVLAAYFISRTPGDVLGGTIVSSEPVARGSGQVQYTLEENRSAAQIGADLEALGVIRSGRQLELLVSLMGVSGQLSAGDYTLKKGVSTLAAIDAITVKDSVATLRVTFPEGTRYEEMAVIAEKAGFGTAEEFLDAVKTAVVPPEIAGELPSDGDLQGFLFPDTYILPVGSTSQQLVELMLKTFVSRAGPEIRAGLKNRGLTLKEGVTLASIVEREAVVESERPLIAAVFYNRIVAGDRLGADPTVQYAVALDPESVAKHGWWKKELTLVDLDNPSKYNTRKFVGIPPGPIANPGLASLEAVAKPAVSKAYFFVADASKGDGSHVFAETLADHERNQQLYGSR